MKVDEFAGWGEYQLAKRECQAQSGGGSGREEREVLTSGGRRVEVWT